MDHSPWDGPEWMLANLDGPPLPTADLMFGHRVKWTLPWTAEGQAHQLKLRQQGIETSAVRVPGWSGVPPKTERVTPQLFRLGVIGLGPKTRRSGEPHSFRIIVRKVRIFLGFFAGV